MSHREPDFTDRIVIYALLLDKLAIGVYTSHAKAEEAWDVFLSEEAAREQAQPDQTLQARRTGDDLSVILRGSEEISSHSLTQQVLQYGSELGIDTPKVMHT
jgi:hypothetical protein